MKNNDTDFQVLAAKYIMGECNNIEFAGPKEKVECIAEVLRESRNLYNALEDPSSSLEKIMTAASKKNAAAQKFKKITGKVWHF